MPTLKGLRVAILATDGVEELELTEPMRALSEADAEVEILSNKLRPIHVFRQYEKSTTLGVHGDIKTAQCKDYNAVLLPGGALNAEILRALPEVQSVLRQMQAKRIPIAATCHAAWELISAGLVCGRTLTGHPKIRDDIQRAGGNWSEQGVVVDDNWITSRLSSDLSEFNREMLNLFSQLSLAGSYA
ncbi:MAG: DJ-1/PfpI family protein [Aphanocapsa sp. GSE-SYN-MK-11-07L]|jgi:protease I|nr:DJ-1/PfpI family protein [Aphanocapsa sp. GSE-SYN-MK-11-07L]